MTNKDKIIALLRKIPKLSYPEISQLTEIPLSTVRYTIRGMLFDGSLGIKERGYGHSPTVYTVKGEAE